MYLRERENFSLTEMKILFPREREKFSLTEMKILFPREREDSPKLTISKDRKIGNESVTRVGLGAEEQSHTVKIFSTEDSKKQEPALSSTHQKLERSHEGE